MKPHYSPFAAALLALTACSSTTNAPINPGLEDSASAETLDEDTGTEEDSATMDSAAPDTRPAVDSSAPDTPRECSAGGVESEVCGKCGKRTRTCTSAGSWSSWGACTGEGVCSAGESRTTACGKCGTSTDTCSTMCTWSTGTCSGEGVCTAGAVETESGTCTGKNVRTRTCASTCAWSDWACVPPKGWVDIATSPLAARSGHTAIWTGTEMIVWGGGASLTDGAAYSVATDTWRTLPAITTSVPGFVGRQGHSAVWTGSKMIVWGGASTALFNDGAMYDPAAGGWTALPATTLSGRLNHTAVWTGSEMIVWGGQTSSGNVLRDGAAYNPTTGWRAIAAVPAGFGGRYGHTAVWAGGKMIIFGGYDYFGGFTSPLPNSCAVKTATSYCGDAASYDPVTDTWVALTPPTPSLDPRQRAAGLVAGSSAPFALFWGGWGNISSGSQYRNSGAMFDVGGGTWTTMPVPTETIFPGAKRYGMAAWSSGGTVSFWGGTTTSSTTSANGASYDLAASTWKALPTTNAPTARNSATAVWTGSEAIVWGGQGTSGALNDGKIYRP